MRPKSNTLPTLPNQMITKFDELCRYIWELEQFPVDENLLAAVVLGLAAGENIVVSAKHTSFVDKVLRLIMTNIFGTTVKTVSCSKSTTWNDISGAFLDTGVPPQVVIFQNLDHAPSYIQSNLLNALIRRRINQTPLHHLFLGICLVSSESKHSLNKHLKQHFFLWHVYDGDNEEVLLPPSRPRQVIPDEFFEYIRFKSQQNVTITPNVKRYMQDIVIFLRTHRLVRGGVSSKACKDLDNLVCCLAVLQNYTFVTPSIVQAATRKIFPLKIELCDPKDEPTLHYGGDVKLITKWLDRWDQDLIIEDVLNTVQPPM